MSQLPDENGRLVSLLRALQAPEPPSDFRAGARRRYLEAIEARYGREVFAGLVAALLGLVLVVALLVPAVEPALFVAWLAEATADVARWATGMGVVLSLVPLVAWTSAALGFAASVLSLVLLGRARALALVK